MSKNKQKTLNLPEQQKKPLRTWKFEQLQAAVYENPTSNTKLNFTDRLNTNYIVENEPIEELTHKDTTTYKDYIARALDPNIDSNNNVYGLAKKLEPLTTRINRMKANIKSANSQLGEYIKQAQAYNEQLNKEKELKDVQNETKQETEPSAH